MMTIKGHHSVFATQPTTHVGISPAFFCQSADPPIEIISKTASYWNPQSVAIPEIACIEKRGRKNGCKAGFLGLH
jgi:hypothetical protein